jgi:O-antigen ligase
MGLAWIASLVRDRRWPSGFDSAIFRAALVLALFTVLSAVFSRDPHASSRHLAGLSLLLLLPITMDLVRDTKQARAVLLALAASGIVLALFGFVEFAKVRGDLYQRITGGLSHWMTFSGLTMIAACVLGGIALESRGRRGMVAALAGLVPLAGMILSFTRNAYVGVLVALVSYLALRRPKGLLVAVPALVLFFFVMPGSVKTRFESIASMDDGSNRDRVLMAEAGLRMIKDSPIVGVGPEEVRALYPKYRDPAARDMYVPHLHDNAVQIAAANGLPAAAAYLAMMAFFFVRTARLLRGERDPARAAILAACWLAGTALFVAGFFEYNFGDTEVEMATLLVLAIPFSRAVAREN